MNNLEQQDLTGKTILFALIAGPKGEAKVYKDCGHCCLVDLGFDWGGTSKTLVFKTEILKVFDNNQMEPILAP